MEERKSRIREIDQRLGFKSQRHEMRAGLGLRRAGRALTTRESSPYPSKAASVAGSWPMGVIRSSFGRRAERTTPNGNDDERRGSAHLPYGLNLVSGADVPSPQLTVNRENFLSRSLC